MAYEIGEVISLLIALVGYFVLIAEYRHQKNLFHLFLAYTLLLVGAIATVAEGFFLPDILNFLEHSVGIALAGLAFCAAAFLSYKRIGELQRNVKQKMRSV